MMLNLIIPFFLLALYISHIYFCVSCMHVCQGLEDGPDELDAHQ